MRVHRAIPFLCVLSLAVAVVPASRPKAAATLAYKVIAIDTGVFGGTWSEGNAININGQVAGTAEANFCPGDCPHGFVTSGPNGGTFDIGAFGPGSWATAVNLAGQATGGSYFIDTTQQHAFKFSPNTGLIDITPAASFGRGVDINTAGAVAGYLLGSDGRYHAFIFRDAAFPLEDLGTITSAPTLRQIEPLDMNDGDEVVGIAYQNLPPNAPGVTHGFLYSGGVMTDLTPNGGWASSINDSGQVTGFENTAGGPRAFRYVGGTKTQLPLPSGGSAAWGYFINGPGQVAGLATVAGSNRGFLYDPAANASVDIGAPAGQLVLKGLNNAGQIVGTLTPAGGNTFAFLYSAGVFYDLNTLIPTNSGWFLSEARAINDGGQITGVGVFQGQNRAFLLTAADPLPVANDDTFLAAEDVGVGIRDDWLLQNDVLPNPAGPFTITYTTQPSHGRLIPVAPELGFNKVVYFPDSNYSGQDSFKYKFNDGVADSNEATITIEIPAVNDPPVAQNDSGSTPEDVPISGNVLSNDTDVEGDPLTAVLVQGPASGTLVLNLDGSFDYTPPADFFGTVTFTYQAADAEEVSAVATVTITVTAVNDPPVATADGPYSIADNTPLTIAAPGVLGNDTDIDNPLSQLTAIRMSDPAHGTLTLNSDGSFTYTSDPSYNGPDSFTYRVSDGQLFSNVVTVSITVAAVNDPPVATNDSFTATEDVVLNVSASGVLSNDTDPDGAPPTIAQLVTGPAIGTLDFRADGSFTYIPPPDFNGQVTFTYRASDGTAFSAPATVTITITPVNDAPVANPDGPFAIAEDTQLMIAAAGVLGNDTDADTAPGQLTAVKVSDPAHGTLLLGSNGSFVYTPAPNYNGPDSFTYQVSDGQLLSNVATVTITVTSLGDPPVARNDFYTIAQNSGAPSVLVNDTAFDAGSFTAVLVTPPTHGTLTLNSDGTFSYVPASATSGPDSFTYKAMNGGLASNVATVSVNNTCSISWKSAAPGLWRDAANWDTNQVPNANDDVCIGVDGTYVVTVDGDQVAGNLTIAGDSLTAPILSLLGSTGAEATLTVSHDTFNAGAINLEGSGRVALTVAGVLGNFASGRLNVAQNVQADLAVTLDNRGIVMLLGDVTFTGGTITNWAFFQSRQNVTLNASTFVQQAGTLSAEKAPVVSGGTFTYNGGNINGGFSSAGTVVIRNSSLNFNASKIANFNIEGTSTLAGGIPAGSIVTVAAGSATTLTITGDLLSAGLLGFGAGAGPGQTTLAVVSGILTNVGTFDVGQSDGLKVMGSIDNQGFVRLTGPTAFDNATVTNRGTFESAGDVTLGGTTFIQAAGTLHAAGSFSSDPRFKMTNGTFNFSGGTINSALGLHDSLLNSTALTGSGEFVVTGASTLTGVIRAGERVIAKGIAGGTTLSAVGGVTNQGELGVSGGSFGTAGSAILTTASAPLLNNGTLFTDGGSQGARPTLSGDIDNQGTIDIRSLTVIAAGIYTNGGVVNLPSFMSLEINGGTFQNVAPGSIAGGGFLLIGSGARFFGTGAIAANVDNAGEFNPGLSPGLLTITGSYQQQTSGVFVAEINGPVAGVDYDRMTVTGAVNLTGGLGNGGTLRVNVSGSSCPQGVFSIISSAGVVGDFATKTIANPFGGTATATPTGAGYDVTFTGCNPPTDTTPPQLTLPGNLTFEATGPAGAVVTYTATATDVVDGGRPVTCDLASGSTFPLGTTTVTCSATDLSSNTATGTFTVQVVDTTAPTLTLPGNLVTPATGPSGAVVTYSVAAADLVSAATVTCVPPPGSTFPIGTTTVSCSARDAGGNTGSGSFTVTVTNAASQVTDLIQLVNSFNLAGGLSNSLLQKLQAALDLINAGKTGACGKLDDFINAVSAQAGKGLTQAQATQLIIDARRVKTSLGC